MSFIKTLAIVSALVLAIDLVWIQWIMKEKYTELIPRVQGTQMVVRYFPALISYFTIILPVVLFSIPNVSPQRRFTDSLFYGGILGMCMYGMFSFTNYALIKNWTLEVVALDTIWGGILYTIVTYVAVGGVAPLRPPHQ